MTATSTNLPAKAQIVAGGPVAALIPQDLDQAFRLSQALAVSGMAPRGMDKAEQIMVAIMAGAELGLAPFQALQSFAVVNGRPTLWGDGLIAVVRARGVRVKEWLDGEGDGMIAHCIATRPDTGEEIARTFSVADAKKAGLWGKQGPWQQYPKRMLQMRARALALRDGCADMLRGIQVREEVEDFQTVRDVTPPRTAGLRERLAGPQAEGFNAATAPAAEAEAPEAETQVVDTTAQAEPDDFPGDRAADDTFDMGAWAEATSERIDELASVADLDAFAEAPDVVAAFERVQQDAPTVARALDAKLRGKRKALVDRERGA